MPVSDGQLIEWQIWFMIIASCSFTMGFVEWANTKHSHIYTQTHAYILRPKSVKRKTMCAMRTYKRPRQPWPCSIVIWLCHCRIHSVRFFLFFYSLSPCPSPSPPPLPISFSVSLLYSYLDICKNKTIPV